MCSAAPLGSLMICICFVLCFVFASLLHTYCFVLCICIVQHASAVCSAAPLGSLMMAFRQVHPQPSALVGLSARTHTIVAHYDPLGLHQQPTRQNAPTARTVGPGLNASLKSRGPPPCIQSYKAFRRTSQKCRLPKTLHSQKCRSPKTQPAPLLGNQLHCQLSFEFTFGQQFLFTF